MQPETTIIIDIVFENLTYELDEEKQEAHVKGAKGAFGSTTDYPGQDRSVGIVVNIPDTIRYDGKDYKVTQISALTFDRAVDVIDVNIPSSVTSINWSMFNCFRLKAFHVAEESPYFYERDGVLFSKRRRELVAYPNMHGEVYDIPKGTTIIGGRAFKSCSNLRKVTIPSSVINMGINVFYDCGALDIYLPDDFKIVQEYTQASAPFHYDKLRFHLCGKVYSVKTLNEHLRKQYNLK